MRCFCIISIALLFVSCANTNYSFDVKKIGISDKNTIEIVDTMFFDCIREIVLETNTDCVISDIEKILQHDTLLYIKDIRQNKLFIFSQNGRHLHTIKDIGRGHGEYISLIDVAVDNAENEILLLVEPHGIMHYTLYGDFKYKESLGCPYTDICCDSNYYYLRKETYANNKMANYSVTIINKRSKDKKDVLELKEEYAPFCSIGPRIYDNGDRLYFTRFFDNIIYRLKDGDVTPEFSIDFNNYEFPSENKRISCSDLFDLANKNKYIYAVSKLKTGKRFVMLSSNLFDTSIIDMETDKCTHSVNLPMANDLRLRWMFYPIYGTGSDVCAVINASVFVSLNTIIDKNPSERSKFSEKAIKYANGFKMGDNPLIRIYRLR